MPAREVHIHNAHPRLKLDRRAVAKIVHTLDARFRYTESDLPLLTPAARKTAEAQLAAQGAPASPSAPSSANRKSKIVPSEATGSTNRKSQSDSSPTASLVTGHWSFSPAVPPGELSLAFLTDAALARIHDDFLDDPTTTDVITFEGNPTLESAGEICVSADTAATFAATHDRDFSDELTLYVVHGWLHLAGYDDLKPAKKRRMRAAESRAMDILRAAKALPRFTLGKSRA
ncbi:rRNA maturation RNase YbeY [Nibricoccus aquaticus]|uniref:Endoribonuclease YbeY n=1 Tax=Nibricoccus aquaticus TaxID=2576891 RepID=A0A290QKV0_9BACT|nr:rRNA maturation RNase YbeY [Nibricoccus aquaticus]ATC65988.1 rRNA maturation RNase YbeY [Nibricoccus aquaticus]